MDVVFKSSVNYLHYPEIVVNHLLHIYNDEDTSYIITDQTKGKMDVELKGLAKSFGKVTAINNMNLEIEQGEFLVLLGPSGCGKTTALRMIAGLETIETV